MKGLHEKPSYLSRITEPYLRTQKALHADPRGYGGKGHKWADAVEQLIHRFKAGSVLDYGCGQGRLIAALKLRASLEHVRLAEYDVAIEGKNGYVEFADLVVCTDMLEHVEPELLDNNLQHIKRLARKAVFVVIATRPSNKTLIDGRNAHLIVEQADWWQTRMLGAGFRLQPDPPVSPLLKPSREWVAVLTC